MDGDRAIRELGKMTTTFDTQSYGDLLVRYQPKSIATEAENDRAIALAEELEHRSGRSLEEETLLNRLLTRSEERRVGKEC